LSLLFILLGVSVTAYKIKYDGDADVLTVILREKGELSCAEEVGDTAVHFDEDQQQTNIALFLLIS